LRSVDVTMLELERAIKHEQVYGQLPGDLSGPVRAILEDRVEPELMEIRR
jgi:hypothetical protein